MHAGEAEETDVAFRRIFDLLDRSPHRCQTVRVLKMLVFGGAACDRRLFRVEDTADHATRAAIVKIAIRDVSYESRLGKNASSDLILAI
jgi:hypothetical protein